MKEKWGEWWGGGAQPTQCSQMRENEPNCALPMHKRIEAEPIIGRFKVFFFLITARLYNSIKGAIRIMLYTHRSEIESLLMRNMGAVAENMGYHPQVLQGKMGRCCKPLCSNRFT